MNVQSPADAVLVLVSSVLLVSLAAFVLFHLTTVLERWLDEPEHVAVPAPFRRSERRRPPFEQDVSDRLAG